MTAEDDNNHDPNADPTSANLEKAASGDERKTISEEELDSVLKQHRTWLSAKRQGQKDRKKACLEGMNLALPDSSRRNLHEVDLRGAILRNVKFSNVDLSGADLRGANLTNSEFDGTVDLTSTDFRGCDLSGAKFDKADVSKAKFRSARLTDADLKRVDNLLPMDLAATDLTRASLSKSMNETIEKEIDEVGKRIKLCRSTSFLMLAISIFVFFVMATTSDVELLGGKSAKTVPLIDFDLPVTSFFIVMPIIVLAVYMYLMVYILALFEELSLLPAIFPDGRKLDQHVEPWIVTSLVHWFFPHLTKGRPSLSWLRSIGALVVAWPAVPLVLGYTWFSYIKMHDVPMSCLHILLFIISLALGHITWRSVKSKLRGKAGPDEINLRPTYRPRWYFILPGMAIGSFIAIDLSLDFIERGYYSVTYAEDFESRSTDMRAAPKLMPIFSLNVSDSDVSGRPSAWQDPLSEDLKGRDEAQRIADTKYGYWEGTAWREVYARIVNDALRDSGVEAADLSRRDLRALLGDRAFFAGSRFIYSELEHASLANADLRGANLAYANANRAVLAGASLQGAHLQRAELGGVDLSRASLKGAVFLCASLGQIDFTGEVASAESQIQDVKRRSILTGADMTRTDFQSSNLEGAVLILVNAPNANFAGSNMKGTQLTRATLKDTSFLQADLQNAVFVEAKLQRANFRWANLKGASFASADLEEANFRKANLEGANFALAEVRGANFSGAVLSSAIIAQDQLDHACGDEDTRLPEMPENLALKKCSQEDYQENQIEDLMLMEQIDCRSNSEAN